MPLKRGNTMRIVTAIALVWLVVMLGAGIFSSTDDVPEKEGAQSPPVSDVQKNNTVQQDDTEELETPEDLEKFLQERYSTPQDIVDFLPEDAIQKCLEYHIFENPHDWELNLFALPLDIDRTKYFSSNTACYHLIDGYYIYVFMGGWDPSENPILDMSIINSETEEGITLLPDTFPEVLELLKQKVGSSSSKEDKGRQAGG